ncbi:MAG: acyltransferase [Muribaculaceae bacterium]|nr:acyltransferase [Muribaculaceae bacterium]
MSKRIEFIDLAKGICILMVLGFHSLPELSEKFTFLSALRMPLYFCLSGLFFKDYGSIGNLLIKKTDRILIPFFTWYLIGYLIYYSILLLTGHYPSKPHHILDLFYNQDFINIPLWFLLSLFWCNLLFAIISTVTKRELFRGLLVVTAALIGSTMPKMGISNYLYIGSSLTCLPFFYMGYLLKKLEIIHTFINGNKRFIIPVSALLVIAGILLFSESLPMLNYRTNVIAEGNLLSIYLFSLALIILLLCFCKFINRIIFISWVGRYSIILLVTHGLILNVLFNEKITEKFSEIIEFNVYQIAAFFITLTISSALIPFCKKFLPYITAQKYFLEEKIFIKKFASVSEVG